MKIYIARGDDTLGPYQPAEAADLVKTGFLFPNDLAARNNDPAWVALSSLLPAEKSLPSVPVAPEVNAMPRVYAPPLVHSFRPQWFLAGILPILVMLAAGLLVVNLRRQHGERHALPSNAPGTFGRPQVFVPTANGPPALAALTMAAPTAASAPGPTVEDQGGRWTGTVSLTDPDGTPVKFAGVQVRAYPVEALAAALEKTRTAVQAELARLAPLIEAANVEKNARVAEEKSALQAFLDAGPSDADLRSSLQFAHEHAKASVQNAELDCRYYLDQRHDAMNGEIYFQDLPAPVAETTTDADGAFTIELPPGGPFALAVRAGQATTDSAPHLHYWLVKLPTASASGKSITLSDANMASANNAGSLIQTED